jgi:hypothetical protein
MKKLLLPCLAAAFAATIVQAAPADDVKAAAQKLADAPSYAWTRTTEIANSQFPAMPVEGVAEKGGFTVTTTTFQDNKFQTVRKGEKVVRQNQEGTWMTNEEMAAARGGGGGGRGGFGMFGAGQQNPAEELATLVGQAKDLKVADGVISGALSEEAVRQRLSFGGRGGQAPAAPKNASGSLKIWLKDGAVVKYAVNVKGIVAGRDGEQERDVTSTTEFKNVGSAKVVVPEEAKKKIGA